MQKKSEFTINGKVFNVITEVPENLCEQIGHSRASSLLASFGIAHWVQAGVKRAFAICDDPGKASDKVKAEAAALRASVIGGESLNIVDFVPAARGEGKKVAALRDKWPTSTPEKRLAFLTAKGLDKSLVDADIEEIVPLYIEWLDNLDKDELDG